MEVTGIYEQVLNVVAEADKEHRGGPIPVLEIVGRAEPQGLEASGVPNALVDLAQVGLITLTDEEGGPPLVVGKEIPTFVVRPGGGQFAQLTSSGRQWLLGQGPVAGIPEALEAELYAADEGLGEWHYRMPIQPVRRIWDVVIERLASTRWVASDEPATDVFVWRCTCPGQPTIDARVDGDQRTTLQAALEAAKFYILEQEKRVAEAGRNASF